MIVHKDTQANTANKVNALTQRLTVIDGSVVKTCLLVLIIIWDVIKDAIALSFSTKQPVTLPIESSGFYGYKLVKTPVCWLPVTVIS